MEQGLKHCERTHRTTRGALASFTRHERSERDPIPNDTGIPATDKKSLIAGEARKEGSSKLAERHANVYENKGPLWKTQERSLNVFENKGT